MDAQSISLDTPNPQLDRIHPHQTNPCHPSHSAPDFSYQSTLVVCPFPFPACSISFKTVSIVSGPIPSAYPIMYFTSDAFGHDDTNTPVPFDSSLNIDTFGGSPLAPALSVVSKFISPSERLCFSRFCWDVETRVGSFGVQDRQSCLRSSRATTRWLCSVQSHCFRPAESPWSGGPSEKVSSPLSTSWTHRSHKWVASLMEGFVCATAANRSTHAIVT